MRSNMPRQIVIVGGGNAGWMAANMMARQWVNLGIKITVIESAKIGPVGVGEGSTPYIKEFFNFMGICEQQWMPACNATYKCGINFPNWSSNNGHTSYFHPFYDDLDTAQAKQFFANSNARRTGVNAPVLPDDYFISSVLAQQNKAPINLINTNQPISYGYHFDANLLGQFLRQHALSLGVIHIQDEVTKVHLDKNDNIAILETTEHGPCRGDFFIDCSGFKGLLIQQTLNEKMISYRDQLFNDSAVAIATPNATLDSISCQTVSKALKYGWVWHIPLINRVGNGYVYCSNYINEQQAEQELRDLLGEQGVGQKALHLHWKPGRIENHWKNNCLAIGLSQGFLEPLEAPMLYITQRSIESFIAEFTKGDFTNKYSQDFNDEINNVIDGTRDYLQAHYKLNSRSDTAYWRDNRKNLNLSTPLSDLLTGWLDEGNFDQVLAKHQDQLSYLKTSWYCLFAGKGYFNAPNKRASTENLRKHQQAQKVSQALALSYPDHFSYLQQVYR